MDLSGIIIGILGVLFFFGGAAWLEILSRKSRLADAQGEQLPQLGVKRSGGRSADSRVAKSD